MEGNIIIGLFGGSFDPIHNGHLRLADWTRKQLSLNRVIFVPAAIPPHKKNLILSDVKYRYQIVQIAIDGIPYFEVSDIELKRKGISYTIDTILYLKKKYAITEKDLYLIIGADSLIDFHNWKNPNKILDNCQVVCLRRPQINLDNVPTNLKKQVMILDSPLIDISATEIREKVKSGAAISHLVPSAVEKYIIENDLYQ